MKKPSVKNCVVALLALLGSSQAALATEGGLVGNGGDGVRIRGRTHLLDFVERGIENDAFVADLASLDARKVEEIRVILDPKLTPLGVDSELVARKMAEIRQKDAFIAHFLTWAIREMDWALVRPELVNIPDEDTVLEIVRGTLVQLAIRRDRTIRINQAQFRRLDPTTRAGLIFHEIVYAALPFQSVPVAYAGAENCATGPGDIDECLRRFTGAAQRQVSSAARDFVGYLFESDVRSRDSRDFESHLPFTAGYEANHRAVLSPWVDSHFAQPYHPTTYDMRTGIHLSNSIERNPCSEYGTSWATLSNRILYARPHFGRPSDTSNMLLTLGSFGTEVSSGVFRFELRQFTIQSMGLYSQARCLDYSQQTIRQMEAGIGIESP